MTRMLVPSGVTGCNVATDASWWHTRVDGAPAGLGIEVSDAGAVVTTVSEEGEDFTLLAVEQIAGWLPGDTHDARLAAIEAWQQELLDLAAAHPSGTIRLVGLPGPPSDVAELVERGAGRRWPVVDPAEAARHDATAETVEIPRADAPTPLGRFATALGAGLKPSVQTAWSTVTVAVADAVASLDRGTAVPTRGGGWVTPTHEQARELLRRTRALVLRLDEAGVPVLGCRSALLWPVPVSEGRVVPEVAAEVVAEVLRGQVQDRVVWPSRLDRINALELDVLRLRREARKRRARVPDLSTLGGRDLVGLLRRRER